MDTAQHPPLPDPPQGYSLPGALYEAASAYRNQGWSVLPLVGDKNPNRAKQPAIHWRTYQKHHPSTAELADWFLTQRYAALGIVTGHISQLVVLDFDNTQLYLEFAQICPDLVETYTVKTARGRHLYFHIPASLSLPSRKIPGLDIQAEGRYVVAPPSIINGYEYRVQINLPLHTLTPTNIQQIKHFLDARYSSVSLPTQAHQMAVTDSSLIEHYQALAIRFDSRNGALYRLSHEMKRRGHTEVQTAAMLAPLHAAAPTLHPHRTETYAQRLVEAHRTIHSAYQAEYSPPLQPAAAPAVSTILDQAVREHLLQRDTVEGTAFLRVYEGLLLKGIKLGDQLTIKAIRSLLAPLGIGRPAVQRALNTQGLQGQFLIERVSTPSLTNPTPLNTENTLTDNQKKPETRVTQTNGVQTTNHTKTQKPTGRPAQLFRFPGVDALCQRLGIHPAGGGDPLEMEALASPHAYRQAFEYAFIQRRPGTYHLGLLAGRIGVCIRTIQRYHAQSGVQTMPTYERVCGIGWLNLDDLPPWKHHQASKYCLQDDRGRRYSARPETAVWLLRRKRQIWLMARGPNFYWVDAPPFPALARAQLDTYLAPLSRVRQNRFETCVNHLSQQMAQQYKNTGQLDLHALASMTRAAIRGGQHLPATHQLTLFSVAESPKHLKPKTKPKRYYHRPLPDNQQEKLAQRIHTFTNPGTANGFPTPISRSLSLVNARRLVETYGFAAVSTTLNKTIWLQEQSGHTRLSNPAGFLIVASRIAWRSANPEARGDQVPRFHAEQRAKRPPNYQPERDEIWRFIRSLILFTTDAYLEWRTAFWASLGLADHLLTAIPAEDIFRPHENLPDELPY